MPEAICPNGHLSDTADYCDQCGARIGGDPAPAPGPASPTGAASGGPSGATGPCPACAAPNAEGDRFCEACGYDMTLGPPGAASPAPTPDPTPGAPSPVQAAPTPATPSRPMPPKTAAAIPTWELVAAADQDYYDRMQAADIPFPAVYPERTFCLTTLRCVIGRRSVSRGINPEVDLSGAPEDPGVSHLHAVLVGSPDGGWSIIDPGSSNGTFLNDSADPIAKNSAVHLTDGDQLHIGAWTTLTLRQV